jgi:hypothetical protein
MLFKARTSSFLLPSSHSAYKTLSPSITMPTLFRRKKTTASATALVVVRAIRDSADAFPPLKSAAAAVMVIWGMVQVCKTSYQYPARHSFIYVFT